MGVSIHAKNRTAPPAAYRNYCYGTEPCPPQAVRKFIRRRMDQFGAQADEEQSRHHLLAWAKENNRCLAYAHLDALPEVSHHTSEHSVRLEASTRRALKILKAPGFGQTVRSTDEGLVTANCLEYLYRLELMNSVFLTDINVEGVTLLPTIFEDEEPVPTLVISQEWYLNRPTTISNQTKSQRIERYMRMFRFNSGRRTHQWYRLDGVYVADARVENFVDTVDGIRPVDLIINRL